MMSKEPSAVTTPAERLDDLLGGFQATQALHVAAKLSVACGAKPPFLSLQG
jgi:hypothetical protein